MRFRPNADRLFVLPQPLENVSGSEPDNDRRIAQTGRIVAVGPGIMMNGTLFPPSHEVGQLVVFQRGTGSELSIDGVPHVILFERELLGDFADENGEPVKQIP